MERDGQIVTVYRCEAPAYPEQPPFHPMEAYPEYPFGAHQISSQPNTVYAAVRSCFQLAGLDAGRAGTQQWNPLRELVRPGEMVVLKPNLVSERHPRDPRGWEYVLTHGSIVRAVCDYVWKALEGRGNVILADAPQTDSSFHEMVRILGLAELVDFYRGQGLDLELVDLRQEEFTVRDGVAVSRRRLPGDPYGAVAFDLGVRSEFVDHRGAGSYYGADYDAGEVNRHHSGGRHEYLIAASAIQCDVLFSLPKLKTHKKAGITVSMKNLVGINADKNWLPHHTEGPPRQGGDEHPNPDFKHRLERRLAAAFRALALRAPGVGPWLYRKVRGPGLQVFGDTEEVIRSGNWWGNDTVWRMCLDLNKIAVYGRPDGGFREPGAEGRKRHLVLVDGIVGGQGRGPMNPDPYAAGVVVFGTHAPSVDAACALLMGFDPEKIPIVRQAFRCRSLPLAEHGWREVQVRSNAPQWRGPLAAIPRDATMSFEPHFGWKGHIERSVATPSAQLVEAPR